MNPCTVMLLFLLTPVSVFPTWLKRILELRLSIRISISR